jgi:hypothetical protein
MRVRRRVGSMSFLFPEERGEGEEEQRRYADSSVKRSDIIYARSVSLVLLPEVGFLEVGSLFRVARYLSNERYSKRVSMRSILSSSNHHGIF